MLASPRTTVLAVLYALVCAAIVAPVAIWSRGASYIAGNLLGSLVIWGVLSAAVAWLFTLFLRADRRAPIGRAIFGIVLFVIATLMVYARVVTTTP